MSIDRGDITAPHARRPSVNSMVAAFLNPLSVPRPLAQSFGMYEGTRGPRNGPPMNTVGSYSSPFAPNDPWSLGVLADARNRVGF